MFNKAVDIIVAVFVIVVGVVYLSNYGQPLLDMIPFIGG